MPTPFIWFDLRAANPHAARTFYEQLLEWNVADSAEGGPAMIGGEGEQPWGSISATPTDGQAWLPYVQVEDLDQATERAQTLGATVVQEKTLGPAGWFTTIADPTGAAIALWQPGG